MAELLAQREVVQEGPGYFVIGPLLTAIVNYMEQRLLQVANDMGASAARVVRTESRNASCSGLNVNSIGLSVRQVRGGSACL